jgi:hypothetical protein
LWICLGWNTYINIAAVADTIIIAGVFPDGAGMVGLFTFAQYLTSLIQAPQRSIVALQLHIYHKHGRIRIIKRSIVFINDHPSIN